MAGLAAGALWGLVFIAPSLAGGLTAIDLVGGRFLFYALMSLVVMAFSSSALRLPTPSQAGAALGMSVLGFSGYYLLLVLAIRDVGVEVPSLIIGTIPVWVMLLGKPQGLLWRGLIPGLMLTIVGVVLMGQASFSQAEESAGLTTSGWTYWRGLGFAVLAMVSWTVFALLNSAWLRKHSEVRTTDWTNWLGVGSGLVGMVV